MRIITVILVYTLFFNINAVSQKIGDKKIIVTVSDTANIYNRVKRAIIKSGFIVKDDMNSKILTTNVTVKKFIGYTVIKAEINQNTVTVWGRYSNKNQNLFDIDIAPGKYKNIVYFKDNKGHGWDIIYSIASEIEAEHLSFEK